MSCDRTWQAEALADGRLGEAHAASFARHMETCAECRDEKRAIDELARWGRRVREEAPAPLDHRRRRERLLERANRSLTSPPRPRWLLAAALFVAVAGGAVLRKGLHRPAALTQTAVGYRVVDVTAAQWSVLEPGAITRLSLRAGTARFQVDPLHAGQRFLVMLPDGELEVRGTEFVVHVEGARTEEVSVESGVVALRIHGVEHLLTAGMRWPPAAPVAASTFAPPPAPVPLPTAPIITPAPAIEVALDAGALDAGPSTEASAGAAFTKAMHAFSAADYEEADRLFAAFAIDHPADARVEDTLFLRAICARRRGDDKAAVERARQYLAKYPSGFHASEARTIVGD